MSPEAQRKALLQVIGWEWCIETRFVRDPNGHAGDVSDLPDNLTAVSEAVAGLSKTLQTAFSSTLFDVCGSWHAAVNATVTQRTKAFLRTIGKWDDSK